MAFIGKGDKGTIYSPGYFLAHNDENVVRETKQIAQSGAVTVENGTKYVPMGSAYPSNDANAIGLTYEDVDVTVGDMPGSVVTGGAEVYEDRLAITGESYDAVTPQEGDNPSAKGWYEKVGSDYVLTTDTTVTEGKTYYAKSDVRLSSAAKTALAAKGFKFIATAPAVTRPY